MFIVKLFDCIFVNAFNVRTIIIVPQVLYFLINIRIYSGADLGWKAGRGRKMFEAYFSKRFIICSGKGNRRRATRTDKYWPDGHYHPHGIISLGFTTDEYYWTTRRKSAKTKITGKGE